MLIRVYFSDNDFFRYVSAACEDIMYTIANGREGYEAIKLYEKERDKYGIENIRKAIALASYGYMIVNNACRLYNEIKYDFSRQEHYMNYLDKIIHIEEVETYNEQDDNSEACYIDFWNLRVDLT